jgi:hypothetical protein
MSGPFTSLGKQVLVNGKHFADAATVENAADMVWFLNRYPVLHEAASNYLHAMSDRTARIAASALREALSAIPPSPSSEAA